MASLLSRTYSCVEHVSTKLTGRVPRIHEFSGISRYRSCSSRPSLHVSPQVGMADEFLDIRATGLTPGQPVVLQGEVDSECGKHRFQSHALYIAGKNGEVEGKIIPFRIITSIPRYMKIMIG